MTVWVVAVDWVLVHPTTTPHEMSWTSGLLKDLQLDAEILSYIFSTFLDGCCHR